MAVVLLALFACLCGTAGVSMVIVGVAALGLARALECRPTDD